MLCQPALTCCCCCCCCCWCCCRPLPWLILHVHHRGFYYVISSQGKHGPPPPLRPHLWWQYSEAVNTILTTGMLSVVKVSRFFYASRHTLSHNMVTQTAKQLDLAHLFPGPNHHFLSLLLYVVQHICYLHMYASHPQFAFAHPAARTLTPPARAVVCYCCAMQRSPNLSFLWLQRRVGAQFMTFAYFFTTNILYYHDGRRWKTRDIDLLCKCCC